MPTEFERRKIQANGLEFEVLKLGRGKNLGLFLHGFPDDARSFLPLMEKFSSEDFTCYAPFLRGYSKGSVPEEWKSGKNRTVSIADLAEDLDSLLERIKLKEKPDKVLVLGHDWGSIAAYGLANLSPSSFDILATVSVPPLPVFLKNLFLHPSQLLRSWYILYFQLRLGIPERSILEGNLLRKLWKDWSPNWAIPEERFREVGQNLKDEEILGTALGYYRGLLTPDSFRDWNRSRELVFRKISLPSVILSGDRDGCIDKDMFEGLETSFRAPFEFHIVSRSGHFLPLENPDKVFSIVLDFWKRYS
ncbi:alpha/beta fold hydrolase [Leptospira wolffii]|uniref:alpha/beta fold hydrolase n=1 Tax=Leptospira wolffii TaxID=409998 RepID=UPI000314FE2A|nr:alpha/beta hydrolase [Leptospira wolffii]EPG67248.1 alpha/beta hydrolase family protein [Leptospira wolffii serovar Khorat str. Khorat-H2]